MTDSTCPECNGSGVYQGLSIVEPCRACGGKTRINALVDGLTASTEGFSAALQKAEQACQQFAIPPIGSPFPDGKKDTKGKLIGNDKRFLGMVGDILRDAESHAELRQDGFPWPIVTPRTSDFYCRVFDADGIEYHDVVSINLQTGEIEQFVRDGFGSIVTENGDVNRLGTKIQTPIRLEKTGRRYREKPFDEIMPAELEGLKVGDSIAVEIHCQDWTRIFHIFDRIIDRPLFGLPSNSFRFATFSTSTPNIEGKPTIHGTLLYKPLSEADKQVIKNSAGETVWEQKLYTSDTCQDMLFIPILED